MINYAQQEGKQYHIACDSSCIGQYVIMPGDPKRCKTIAEYIDNAQLVADNREFVTYTGNLLGTRVSICSTGIGGPSASIAITELAKLGCHTFIRIGTCGGMQTNIVGGDLVIATGAIRQEGTSLQYAPIEYPAIADYTIIEALKKAATLEKAHYHIGVVQSKDSFYGQHEPEVMPVANELINKWQAWIKMGCLASEMESAALFIAGAFLRVKVGACYLVLANQEREKQGLDNIQCHDITLAIKTCINALKILIEQDKNH